MHLPCPLLHTGDQRGWWPAVTRSSLAVPLGQDHEEEFTFSPLGLFACVSSLSLDDVQPAPWECGGATVAFRHVSDAAGDSGLLVGLPFLQCTIQPVPLCSPWATVRQAPSVNLPFPELQRESGAVPQSGPIYPQAPGRGSVLLPPQMWPSMATQSHLTLFSPPRHRSYPWGRGRSVQKTLSSKLPFQPISLLDFGFSFNLETKHLTSLFSASFMAGGAADSCFSRLHLRSGVIVTSARHPPTLIHSHKFPAGDDS